MTTFGDRLFELGGVPVTGGNAQSHPVFGKVWFVDGTNGSDSNDGLTPTRAFATIQAAVTEQIANTTSLGDIIYVFPGSYAESVTGNLTKVQIIGLDCGGAAHAASIRPTAGSAYNGEMMEAAFRNIMFLSSSSSVKTLPAVLIGYMGYSVIDNCLFIGRDGTCVTGLQLGPEADNATAAKCDYSAITNNVFSTFFGQAQSFQYGIRLGSTTSTNAAVKQMWHSLIANNRIMATTTGIHLGCGDGKMDGTVIDGNYIHSMESDTGCSSKGITSFNSQSSCFVTNNHIVAIDGIYGFRVDCLQGNYVGTGNTVATENPDMTT